MPTGLRLDDGHSTKITFAGAPNIALWEKEVTPPGLDGGGPNETTTMRNVTYRTRAAKKLKTVTEMTVNCAYDPAVYATILAQINVPQLITVTFPNTDTYAFFGYINSFVPGALTEGSQPTAAVNIVPTNIDPATGNESAPVFTDVSGP